MLQRIVEIITSFIISPPLIQKVFIVISDEVRLSTCLAAKRLAVTDLLQVIEAAGDSLVAGRVESIKCDAGSAIDAGVHFGTGQDGIQVRIHNTGSRGGIGVYKVGILVGFIIRTFSIAITKRSL
jgi:hypothetical protein